VRLRSRTGVGRAATAILDSSPTAMPWFDEVPRDDFETSLFAKARQLEAQGVDKDRIQDWFRGERMAHAKTKTEAEKKEKTKAPAKAETGQVTSKTNKKELCEIACECLNDRGSHVTYLACVAEKLRKRYYNPSNGQHSAGGPRRPMSETADGPRPEVSYKKGEEPDSKYAPVESRTAPGMPSTAPVVRGAPRPDVSWWQDGALSELWEMKFPKARGGVDGKTNAQRGGAYEEIAEDQSQPGRKPVKVKEIDVAKDCDCNKGSSAS
ncbi:hypothetical protein, partial [Methylobacterium sp. Leaf469]|uniref:hypothetical protein n=1 Tax=Methylobacterium sp. Leaf469 TaxID=1736387 RepID=UPI000B0054F9